MRVVHRRVRMIWRVAGSSSCKAQQNGQSCDLVAWKYAISCYHSTIFTFLESGARVPCKFCLCDFYRKCDLDISVRCCVCTDIGTSRLSHLQEVAIYYSGAFALQSSQCNNFLECTAWIILIGVCICIPYSYSRGYYRFMAREIVCAVMGHLT